MPSNSHDILTVSKAIETISFIRRGGLLSQYFIINSPNEISELIYSFDVCLFFFLHSLFDVNSTVTTF